MSHHHAKSCRGKAKHRSFHAAKLALAVVVAEGNGVGLTPYRCTACGFIHLGHQNKSDRNLARMQRLWDAIDRANGR